MDAKLTGGEQNIMGKYCIDIEMDTEVRIYSDKLYLINFVYFLFLFTVVSVPLCVVYFSVNVLCLLGFDLCSHKF